MIPVILLIGVLTFVWSVADSHVYTQIVKTTYGPVRGEDIDYDGIQYKSFTGIPYAAPPIGDLRFKYERMKMDVGEKIRMFITNAPGVTKFAMRYLRQSEDCLTLNVYTKTLGEDGLKPVLVFIHGGAFFAGDSTDTIYGPEFLVDQDIVLVTFNYRLGPLGFLATNSSDATGNWGLKDQVAALMWVRDNIAQFGGDPKQVTIYGESAGGASVHYHLLSPLSRGLFHRAIAASGASVCSWATTDQQERMSRNLAKELGASQSEIDDPGRRIQYLRTINPKTLTDRMLYALEDEDMDNSAFAVLPFSPVVEPAGTEAAFITEDPEKLLMEGNIAKVPLMMGFNDVEGGLVYMGFSRYTTPDMMKKLDGDACKVLPKKIRDAVIEKKECDKVAQQLRDVYFGGKSFDSDELQYANMFGDVGITSGVHFSQKWHARMSKEDNPVYYYYFTFDGEYNMFKKLFGIKLPGAGHADELTYMFNPRLMKLPFKDSTEAGENTKARMLKLISNFVKTGNPTPEVNKLIPLKWEPATKDELNTLTINADLKMEKDILKTRMTFWEELYKKYLGTPFYNFD